MHSLGGNGLELLAANLSLACRIGCCAVAEAVVIHNRPIGSGEVNRIGKSRVGELILDNVVIANL